jgi:hypothetical protein
MAVVIVGVAIVLAVAIELAASWARRRSQNLAKANAEFEQFYVAAQRLIKDDSVPDSVIDFLRKFATCVGRPELVRLVATDIATGKWGGTPHQPATRFKQDIGTLNEDQVSLLASAVVFGLLSSASSDPFLATVGRRAVEFLFIKPRTTKIVGNTEKAVEIAVNLGPRLSREAEMVAA